MDSNIINFRISPVNLNFNYRWLIHESSIIHFDCKCSQILPIILHEVGKIIYWYSFIDSVHDTRWNFFVEINRVAISRQKKEWFGNLGISTYSVAQDQPECAILFHDFFFYFVRDSVAMYYNVLVSCGVFSDWIIEISTPMVVFLSIFHESAQYLRVNYECVCTNNTLIILWSAVVHGSVANILWPNNIQSSCHKSHEFGMRHIFCTTKKTHLLRHQLRWTNLQSIINITSIDSQCQYVGCR